MTGPESPSATILTFKDDGERVRMHAYGTLETLLASRPESNTVGAITFFDVLGNEYDPVFGPGWALQGLRRVAGQPDVSAVRKRVDDVLASVRPVIEERINNHDANFVMTPLGTPVQSSEDVLPEIGDEDSLEDIVRKLHESGLMHVALEPGQNPGSPLHMLLFH